MVSLIVILPSIKIVPTLYNTYFVCTTSGVSHKYLVIVSDT